MTTLDLAANLTGSTVTEAQEKTWFTVLRAALASSGDPLGELGSIKNLSLVFTVASNALTCNIKTRAGGIPSADDAPIVPMRNATLATADFTPRAITAAVALTLSSGSTVGHQSAVSGSLYWYVIDNAGALELAVSTYWFGSQGIVSTTAEGGAGAADNANVMYSTTARSNVPFYCIGRTFDTQTTAGTWVALPTSGELAPFDKIMDVQTFTGSGTWVKPNLAKTVRVVVVGAGGGGGGARGAAAGVCQGGTGGGGGACSEGVFNATDLSSSETITVGTGGVAGAGGASADGSSGSVGGTSSFGSKLYAYGGGGGAGGGSSGNKSGGSGGGTGGAGTTGSGSDSVGGKPANQTTALDGRGGAGGGAKAVDFNTDPTAAGLWAEHGGAGGGGIITGGAPNPGANGGLSLYGGAGGAGGGGVSGGNTGNGGDGGYSGSNVTGANGGAGGAAPCHSGVNGGSGTALKMGGGGGGGSGCTAGTIAAGNGGNPGGGGGGGGASTSTGGTGGTGGRGEVRVYSFF